MKELKDHLKNQTYQTLYLLYGDDFLKKQYAQAFKKAIIDREPSGMGDMNFTKFDEKTGLADIVASSQTVPFFAERRLVIAKNTELFNKKVDDFLNLDKLPLTTTLVFLETNVDKRTKLYKLVSKIGTVAELVTPKADDLVKWVVSQFKKSGRTMTTSTATYLIKHLPSDMFTISSEIEKLVAYTSQSAQQEITTADIDHVTAKSAETKIFDMLNCIGKKQVSSALIQYKSMIDARTEPLMILAMIARQIRLILRTKALSADGYNIEEIAKAIGARSFAVRDYLLQSKNFKYQALITGLEACLDTDLAIKTGQTTPVIGVEQLIIKLGI